MALSGRRESRTRGGFRDGFALGLLAARAKSTLMGAVSLGGVDVDAAQARGRLGGRRWWKAVSFRWLLRPGPGTFDFGPVTLVSHS